MLAQSLVVLEELMKLAHGRLDEAEHMTGAASQASLD
jgi:hypothetical protein